MGAEHFENERVLDTEALKALAHPLRVQILEAVSAYGPLTASALAERLGESSGATSYHLRQLEKHGFIREDTTRGSARERWWQRVPRPIALDAEDYRGDSVRRMASEMVLSEWQRTRQQRLAQFLAHGVETLPKEWLEASGVMTSNLQLTREQSAELIAELSAVYQTYLDRYRFQRAPGARPVQVHLDVFPLIDGVEQDGAASAAPAAEDVGGAEETETR